MEIFHQSFEYYTPSNLYDFIEPFYFENLCKIFSSLMFNNEVIDRYMEFENKWTGLRILSSRFKHTRLCRIDLPWGQVG